MAQREATLLKGWSLSSANANLVPYLSYDPSTFLGTVVDQTIAGEKLPLDTRYMDALVEALKRRTLSGGGVAWLPELAIRDELDAGELVKLGSPRLEAELTLSMFCSPEKLDETGMRIWEGI